MLDSDLVQATRLKTFMANRAKTLSEPGKKPARPAATIFSVFAVLFLILVFHTPSDALSRGSHQALRQGIFWSIFC